MAVKEVQKFTEEELSIIKNIQSVYKDTIYKLGQLSLSKIKLAEQETFLKNSLKELEQKETEIAQQLSEKYGKGSIDISTGEFTPTE